MNIGLLYKLVNVRESTKMNISSGGKLLQFKDAAWILTLPEDFAVRPILILLILILGHCYTFV